MINVAVVGAGRWGPHLARNFDESPTSQLRYVVDTDSARREALRLSFPRTNVIANFEEAVDDVATDAVVIATPTNTHHALALRALEAGKHVLVEKPITRSSTEALHLCEVAEDRKLILMVGHVFLFNPAIRAVRDAIVDDVLGSVRLVTLQRTNLGPIRADVNAAWDLASHDISIANYLLDAQPSEVNAVGGSWINPGVEDAAFLSLRYPDNILVQIQVSWLHPRKSRMVAVVGERKMATVDDMDLSEPFRIYDKGVSETREESGVVDSFAAFRAAIREGDVLIPKVTLGEPLRAECQAFIERVQGGDDQVSNGWFGLGVVAVLEAATESMTSHGIAVPVKQ